MVFLLWIALLAGSASAQALEVTLLTPQGSKLLKKWSSGDLKRVSKAGQLSAQELVFEDSTKDLDLNERADIDLVTLYGNQQRIARVPRFMIWRGSLKFRLGSDGSLSARASNNPLLVPKDFFNVSGIRRIELSRASSTYPGTRLQVRTNPAASRGEKLYTHSCMACHSLDSAPQIEVSRLNDSYLRSFSSKHRATDRLSLDSRTLRGLVAYREALASEKNGVSSAK
jgi:hypothetical protein